MVIKRRFPKANIYRGGYSEPVTGATIAPRPLKMPTTRRNTYTWTLVLQGEPQSTNNIYRIASKPFPRIYLSAKGKTLKTAWQASLLEQWRQEPLKDPITLDITLYFKVKRVHDVDNYNKILLDCMSKIIFEDDGQITDLSIHKAHDVENPRVVISIKKTV